MSGEGLTGGMVAGGTLIVAAMVLVGLPLLPGTEDPREREVAGEMLS